MTNWDGAEYRQVSDLQQWSAARALANVDLAGARTVLDVGCGDGRITAQIAERLPDALVVGIDPSPAMLAVTPTGSRLSFCRADVTHLPFRDDFDRVLSFNALHWVIDQRRALREIAGALRRGGRAYLLLVCAGPRPSLEQTAMDVTADPAWRRYFTDFHPPFQHRHPAAYTSLLQAAGLRILDLCVEDLHWSFRTAEQFCKWATVGFDAWTSRLPADAIDGFMTDVMSMYTKVTGSSSLFRFMQLTAHLARSE